MTSPDAEIRSSLVDENGEVVVLTAGRWRHIASGHPELLEIETELAAAIRTPDVRREGRVEGEVWLYRRLREGARAPWLKVVVRYGEEGGRIITAFLRRRMP